MGSSDRNTLKIILLDKLPEQMQPVGQMLGGIRACECSIMSSVREALQAISAALPDLIITDWRLRDHSADALLRALKTRREWSQIPVIICASTRSQELKLKGKMLGAYGVLTKPVSQQLLAWHLNIIFPTTSPLPSGVSTQPVQLKPAQTREDIRPLVARINFLAPLPALGQSILDIGNDLHSSASDLRTIIEKDQSLTAKILRTVNSAYYGFHRKIGNIDRAIVILGFNEIMSITLAACIIEAYQDGELTELEGFNRRKFWIHALGAAYVARALSALHPRVSSKDAFVVGLLHDFGKVVLDQHFQPLFKRMLEAARSQNRPLHQVAVEIADIDHAEIGALVAESWKLPPSLVKAIQFHHAPEMGQMYQHEIALAHLANYFCHEHKIGESGNPVPDSPHPESLRTLGIEHRDLGDVWRSLQIDIDSLVRII